MREIILVKYGEIILKGLNRPRFEELLRKNIRRALGRDNIEYMRTGQAITYITPAENADADELIGRLEKVFGIVSIVRAGVCPKDMDAILTRGVDYILPAIERFNTFKVEAKRSDKKFPCQSPEIAALTGGAILKRCPRLKVDVINPDAVVRVEVRDDNAYIFVEEDKIAGSGGMPSGSNGKAVLLLSGGIDSPVAGYMLAKRGVNFDAVHFASPPYTSERAKEKVVELARILARYTGGYNLYVVPFTEQQLAIRQNCPEEHLTLIMRRMMMKTAEKIAQNVRASAMITGESLGQVASQTIQALGVTNAVSALPVFRPLIGMDKEEIVTIARKIGTFETSILPYEDCCTIFTPKHPTTRPTLEKIQRSESRLDFDALIDKAVETSYWIRID